MRVSCFLAILLSVGAASPSRVAAQSSACLGPSAAADSYKAAIVAKVTDTGAVAAADRQWLTLPLVSASDVQLESDSAKCAQALAARQASNPSASGPVFLFRVGTTRYVLFAREEDVGEWRPVIVYDTTFTPRGAWGM